MLCGHNKINSGGVGFISNINKEKVGAYQRVDEKVDNNLRTPTDSTELIVFRLREYYDQENSTHSENWDTHIQSCKTF